MTFDIPVLGICAHASGMGKTTLLTALLPLLATQGVRVSVVKQTHSQFDLDRPGKDSFRMRESGAVQVLLSSPERWVLLTETASGQDDCRLLEMIHHLDSDMADLVLVEGFRHAPIPKIEVYRSASRLPPLAVRDADVIAIASDDLLSISRPCLQLDDIQGIARFVTQWLALQNVTQKKVVSGQI
jgi:molybdopterin-guanine dinucleotide biosynthesis protein B